MEFNAAPEQLICLCPPASGPPLMEITNTCLWAHKHTHTQTQTNSEALNLAAVCFTTQCLACGRAEIVWATTGKLGQEKNYKEVLDLISKNTERDENPLRALS